MKGGADYDFGVGHLERRTCWCKNGGILRCRKEVRFGDKRLPGIAYDAATATTILQAGEVIALRMQII